MKSIWFSVLVVLFIWLNTGYGAAIGQEVCNCQPSIIRTPKISVPTPGFRIVCTKTSGPQQYSPIPNACSCVNTRMTPASIAWVDFDLTATTPSPAAGGGADEDPRPYGERGGAFFPAASECGDAAAVAAPGDTALVQDPPGPDGIDEPAAAADRCGCGGQPAAVAVDPVSLMLAQAEANRCQGGVREGRLAFGPASVPKDAATPSPAAPVVDEEGLYALDKAVVELKTCKRYGQQAAASDTDARLALEEDEQPDEAAAGPAVALPSYADVGYRAETPSCAPLMAGAPVPAPAARVESTVVYAAAPRPACATDAAPPPPRYCAGCGKATCGSRCKCSYCGKISGIARTY